MPPSEIAGFDPIEARKSERVQVQLEAARSITFDDCRDKFIASHRVAWANDKHRMQWERTLETYVTPVFGTLPVQSVDVAVVTKALEPIWTTKPETAGRIRGRIERILDWAKARGFRRGKTPQDGVVTWIYCLPLGHGSGASGIMPRYRMANYQAFWRTFEIVAPWPRVLLSLLS